MWKRSGHMKGPGMRRSLVTSFILVTLLTASALASTRPPALPPQKVYAIRNLIQKVMRDQRAPGATFAVGLDSKIVWSEGFGYADVENHVKAKVDTVYRTASIGKPMTATAAMELWEQD